MNWYQVEVLVSGAKHIAAIEKAMCCEESFQLRRGSIFADEIRVIGECCILDDEDLPEELADRLVQAVWQANQGYCKIEVWTASLEERYHTRDEHDYMAWMEEEEDTET